MPELALTAAPSAIETVTVPGPVIPPTATVYVVGPPVTAVTFPPGAVPVIRTPAAEKPVTGSLNTTVQSIGVTLAGSGCEDALLTVTVTDTANAIPLMPCTLIAGRLTVWSNAPLLGLIFHSRRSLELALVA